MEKKLMNYQVLYRRFRPKSFEEIVGQEHIIPILKNEIATGNISHAYLFSGPRGTGKTSAAKVFARAVNCLSPVDGEACGKCKACTAQDDGALSNIIEIDAASNRGIDEIRQLKENVSFLPVNAKYRVYIIDEVHMLTTEAFNALLKTLEEPPEHIIFIFATTEVYKILPTILSRCQRFDFKRISESVIKENVRKIFTELGIAFEEGALDIIASSADGGMRDALSLADKVLASSEGASVTEEGVQKVLGLIGQDDVFRIAEAVSDENAALAFTSLNDAVEAGADVDYLVAGITEYFRDLMIYTHVQDSKNILYKGEKYYESLKRSSINVTDELLISYMNEFAKIKADSRFLTNSRFLLETAILKLSDKSRLTDTISLTARVEKLESRLDALLKGGLSMPIQTVAAVSTPSAEPKEEQNAPLASPKENTDLGELPSTDKDTLVNMQDALNFASKFIFNSEHNIILSGIFADLKAASFNDNTLYVYPTGSSVHMMDAFYQKDGLNKLKTVLSSRLEYDIDVKITDPPQAKRESKSLIDSAREILGELEEIKE